MAPIFYLGPEGTFSHILARKRFGRGAKLCACPTLDAVLDQTLAKPGGFGLVPIENSSGGTVYDTVDLLLRHAGHIHVREELSLDVRIALLGRRGGEIQTVYSHFIQLKHHADWLKSRYPKARLRTVGSTALAAEKAARGRHAAALASPGAAEIYGLEVLERPALAQAVNVTHFFVIAARPLPEVAQPPVKTAFVAALPNVCGSLHRFLGPFARNSVSLTRIISRPVPGQPQTYVFFIEIDGGPQDEPVRTALARVRPLAESLAIFGTYPIGKKFRS